MKKRCTALAAAATLAALAAGCASAQTTPQPPQDLPEVSTAFAPTAWYDVLMAAWISQAKTEDQYFIRGGRAFPDIAADFKQRLAAGLPEADSRAKTLAAIRERVEAMPKLQGRFYARVAPVRSDNFGPSGAILYDQTNKAAFMYDFKTATRPVHVVWPNKYSRVNVIRLPDGPGRVTGANLGAIFADNKFYGGVTIARASLYAMSPDGMKAPVDPQDLYEHRKKGRVVAEMAGGYYVVDGIKTCETGEPYDDFLVSCRLNITGTNLAPIVLK